VKELEEKETGYTNLFFGKPIEFGTKEESRLAFESPTQQKVYRSNAKHLRGETHHFS
jgi:hypothetical protein